MSMCDSHIKTLLRLAYYLFSIDCQKQKEPLGTLSFIIGLCLFRIGDRAFEASDLRLKANCSA